MWLTRLALRNPVLILMASLMVGVLGFVSLRRLSVDLFPDITIPVIRVATFYSGAGPGDIEKTITQPIERAVSASPGVDRVESTSRQGASIVSVWFNYGVNLDNAQFEVSQRIAQILSSLPQGIQQPFVLKFDITNIPVLQVAIGSDELDEKQLYDLAYNTIEPQLERIRGVASATVGGGKTREVEVKVNRDALRARKLGILDVVGAVQRSNILLPSGHIKSGTQDFNVFANTQVETMEALRHVPLTTTNGTVSSAVHLADVADVQDETADQLEIVRINGSRGVFLRVLKQPGANTIAVVDAVRAAIPKLTGVPASVHLAISFDQSNYIRSAVSALEHEAVQGGLLAIAVILFFLLSVRATGIVALSIPLSIIATFALLFFTGQTLNVFTLGGLALGVGRLVDDSIVELENIHRHLQTSTSRKEAVLAAAQEVAMPILVSTITTIVVFFPVVFLAGVAKNLFVPLALTISFALLVSFFVSRTVTPLTCYYFLEKETSSLAKSKIGARLLRWLDALDHGYAKALTWVLDRGKPTVAAIGIFFFLSLLLSKKIGTEFFPESDESQFTISYKAPIGTRVENTEKIGQKIERAIQQKIGKTAEHDTLYTTTLADEGLPFGRTAIFSNNTGPHTGNLAVNLVGKGDRKLSDVQAAEAVRGALRDELPGSQMFLFVGGIVKRILNFGSAAPIDVEILGYDFDQASQYAKSIAAKMRELTDSSGRPILTDVQISREENYPEFDLEVDRQKAGLLGLSEQQVAQTVLASLVGSSQFAPILYTDPKTGNEYFINVRLDDHYRSKIQDLSDIFVRSPADAMISLDSIAKIKRGSGPVTVQRKYLQRIVDVTANVAVGQNLGEASKQTAAVLSGTPPPDGFSAQLGGQSAAQKAAFADLGFAALMALALVYMVLASQFESLIDPLVIMFSVPLGISGVFLALFITGTTLSVNSFMGIIMMVGIVVSNGVLLVDFANVLRKKGHSLRDATIEAGKTRLRPILMTSAATVIGLLPMALGIGEGSEANLPLARAVIGGLTVSTFFTLFLVPILYTWLDRFARRTPAEAEEPAVS